MAVRTERVRGHFKLAPSEMMAMKEGAVMWHLAQHIYGLILMKIRKVF